MKVRGWAQPLESTLITRMNVKLCWWKRRKILKVTQGEMTCPLWKRRKGNWINGSDLRKQLTSMVGVTVFNGENKVRGKWKKNWGDLFREKKFKDEKFPFQSSPLHSMFLNRAWPETKTGQQNLHTGSWWPHQGPDGTLRPLFSWRDPGPPLGTCIPARAALTSTSTRRRLWAMRECNSSLDRAVPPQLSHFCVSSLVAEKPSDIFKTQVPHWWRFVQERLPWPWGQGQEGEFRVLPHSWRDVGLVPVLVSDRDPQV